MIMKDLRSMIREAIQDATQRRVVRVTYSNGDSIATDVNGTEEEIRDYFGIGKYFNLGSGEHDLMAKVVNVEFLDGPEQMGEIDRKYDPDIELPQTWKEIYASLAAGEGGDNIYDGDLSPQQHSSLAELKHQGIIKVDKKIGYRERVVLGSPMSYDEFMAHVRETTHGDGTLEEVAPDASAFTKWNGNQLDMMDALGIAMSTDLKKSPRLKEVLRIAKENDITGKMTYHFLQDKGLKIIGDTGWVTIMLNGDKLVAAATGMLHGI